MASHPNLFDMKGTSYSIDFPLSNLNAISPLTQHEGQHLSLSLVTLSLSLALVRAANPSRNYVLSCPLLS